MLEIRLVGNDIVRYIELVTLLGLDRGHFSPSNKIILTAEANKEEETLNSKS